MEVFVMTDQFVTVACSKCGAEYQISVTYAGMPGECGVCGEVFVFPSKEDINAAFGYDVCGQVAAAQAAEAAAAAANGAEAQPVAEQPVAEQPPAEQPPVPEAEQPQSVPQEEDQGAGAPSFQGTAPADDEVFTSTIKMSRSKIAGGMIPKLNDDEFQFSLAKKTVTETSAVTEEDIKEIKAILNNDAPAKSGSEPKRKWWQYLLFWIK